MASTGSLTERPVGSQRAQPQSALWAAVGALRQAHAQRALWAATDACSLSLSKGRRTHRALCEQPGTIKVLRPVKNTEAN